jgi:hypothetical protein
MNRLRAIFLAPSAAFTVILFLIPLSIIIAYSFLTRGVYGGVVCPWTLASSTPSTASSSGAPSSCRRSQPSSAS